MEESSNKLVMTQHNKLESKQMIDYNKPLRTKGNKFPVRIYSQDTGDSNYTIHGAYFCNGEWHIESWTKNGLIFGPNNEDYRDLENYSTEIKTVVKLSVYKDPLGGYVFWSNPSDPSAALSHGYQTELTLLAVLNVALNFTEGEGL
jgi:hypothetical protein